MNFLDGLSGDVGRILPDLRIIVGNSVLLATGCTVQEARALARKLLRMKRLPVGAKVTRLT